MFQAAFSPVLTVASCVLWCVGGIEARSTFFPVDDSRPGHGTDCERGLGELLNTHTHACTQTTRPFAEDVACCTLKKIQEFTQMCVRLHTKQTDRDVPCSHVDKHAPG